MKLTIRTDKEIDKQLRSSNVARIVLFGGLMEQALAVVNHIFHVSISGFRGKTNFRIEDIDKPSAIFMTGKEFVPLLLEHGKTSSRVEVSLRCACTPVIIISIKFIPSGPASNATLQIDGVVDSEGLRKLGKK